MLFHFSEDGGISLFVPHVPRTNPSHVPAVWAIDLEHSPLYWFPRDCPRVTAWPRNDEEADAFRAAFGTTSYRVHFMEQSWVERMRTCTLYRYTFDATPFAPWPGASGQWIATVPVEPLAVEPVGDLFEAHRTAGIDLRIVPDLRPHRNTAVQGPWDFSIVRLSHRHARSDPSRQLPSE